MMRFKFGAPPEAADFQPEAEGWRLVRQPGRVLLQLLAIPIAVLVAVLLGAAWYFLTPLASTPVMLRAGEGVTLALVALAGLVVLVMVHEVLHGAGHPGWGFTRDTVLGFWPSRLLFYAAYRGVISRNRYLWVDGVIREQGWAVWWKKP
jgi:hypothetical protein